MTTREFLKKHVNDNGVFTVTHDFYSDLADELNVLLSRNPVDDNLRSFNLTIKMFRTKFDAIANKASGRLQDKHWNYFFATTVVPLREQHCKREMDIIAQRQSKKRENSFEHRFWNDLRESLW